MKDIKISVIIPMYNCSNYIEELLSNLKQQNMCEIEYIFVNDGSTDATLSILYEKAIFDDVKIINQQNRGASSARNEGLKVSKGKYIYFMDSDDLINESLLSKLYDAAEQNDADIVCCSYECTFNGIIKSRCILPNHIFNREEAIKLVLENKILGMSIWNKLFDRRILTTFAFNEKYKINEDRLFLFQAVTKSNKIVTISNILYNYRINLSSISHEKFNISKFDGLLVIENIEEIISIDYPHLKLFAQVAKLDVAYYLLSELYANKLIKIYHNYYIELINLIRHTNFKLLRNNINFTRYMQFMMIKYMEPIYKLIIYLRAILK